MAMTEAQPAHFRRHRFPAEIIAHAVWLNCRFPLSFRDIEDLRAERGIEVSFQTVSEWAEKFDLKFAHQLRQRSRGHFAEKWQLDEMVVTIKGKKYWLWRAVDANGYVLDGRCYVNLSGDGIRSLTKLLCSVQVRDFPPHACDGLS